VNQVELPHVQFYYGNETLDYLTTENSFSYLSRIVPKMRQLLIIYNSNSYLNFSYSITIYRPLISSCLCACSHY
jgi:hypothetical protein